MCLYLGWNTLEVKWMSMRGIKDGEIGKKVMATETKTCNNCYHECHCNQELHADEYGVCVCEECKC